MFAIVNYKMGNLASVANAFDVFGQDSCVTSVHDDLRAAEAIVLPGVGAFADGMRNLRELGLLDVLREEVLGNKKPFLGICLGMQMLATESHEHGVHKGLGWIDGAVVKIEPSDKNVFRVPHIGWNDLQCTFNSSILFDNVDEPVYYFVHSYHFAPDDPKIVTAWCEHGGKVTASIEKGHIFGVQFHPEKSQQSGIKLLNNFTEFVKGRGNA